MYKIYQFILFHLSQTLCKLYNSSVNYIKFIIVTLLVAKVSLINYVHA